MAKTGAKASMDEVGKDGAFQRTDSAFRSWIKADGSSEFSPEAGRYHLVIANACPWACRANAVRMLKGLDGAIDLTVVDPVFTRTRPENDGDQHCGWFFRENDKFMEATSVRDLYDKVSSNTDKFTVPILFDKKTNKIVNNESSEIIRMLNSEFNSIANNPDLDLYPEAFREEIDEINNWVYPMINNGVYKCGFATTQAAYDVAVKELFDGLDQVEDILSSQRYITSRNAITEADVRLFKTLVRFDEVYVQHFKCNKKRIADYPNMENYVREIYQIPEIGKTVNMKEIKEHYFCSHPTINKYSIIAVGPGVDYSQAHDREVKFPLE